MLEWMGPLLYQLRLTKFREKGHSLVREVEEFGRPQCCFVLGSYFGKECLKAATSSGWITLGTEPEGRQRLWRKPGWVPGISLA